MILRHNVFLVCFVIVASLLLQFVPCSDHIAAQTSISVKWVLQEVRINPSGVPASRTYDRRVSMTGREIKAKGFVTTEVSAGSFSYTEWVEDLEGNVLWSQSYSFDFTPPPSEFVTNERFEITVNGKAVCKKPGAGVSGPISFLSGVYFSNGPADSQGNFPSRPTDKYLEVGDRTSYSESMKAYVVGRSAKLPFSEAWFRVDISTTADFYNEKGAKIGKLLVAWIYRAVEAGEEKPPESSPPAVTASSKAPAPGNSSGEDALEILGRIGKEVARERIQGQLKGSLDGLGELLTDTWDSFTGWVKGLAEEPIDWVEGTLADEFGGSDEPESPGLPWEEINEQLGQRIRPVAGVNEESMDELFDKVKNILWEEDPDTGLFQPRRTSTQDIIDIKLNSGGSVKIGILVTPERRILYTPNGKDYFPDLQTAVDPSMYEQAMDLFTATNEWIWDSLFTGSTKNPDMDLQNKVASEVLEDLRIQLDAGESPETLVDWTEGKLWTNFVQDPLQERMRKMLWEQAGEALKNHITAGGKIPSKEDLEYLEIFDDLNFQFEGGELTTPKAWAEFRSRTGIDLFDLTEAGEYAVAGGEFAVESIKTMARGLQDTDFAVRTRAYITERKAGQNIELIYERMKNGELPELDIGSAALASGGVSSLMASSGIAEETRMGVMFSMYEQAYQRYLLAQKMARQP